MIHVERLPILLKPDPARVLVRPFRPGSDFRSPDDAPRAFKIIARVLSLPEPEVEQLLAQVLHDFEGRHVEIQRMFLSRFDEVRSSLPTDEPLTLSRKLLIGSFFTHEYSLESAAIFNPSIVPHPDQSDVPEGALRFVMSLRATGEGHISSITFRSGLIDRNCDVTIDPPNRFVREPRHVPDAQYDTPMFRRKMVEIGLSNDFANHILDGLGSSFSLPDLKETLRQTARMTPGAHTEKTARHMRLLAESNYETEFDPSQSISERIIFPYSPSQTNGIEDARFVQFHEDSGEQKYYATFTAYNGSATFPQLLETTDFLRFKISTLNGPAVHNKGMALFPRKVGGHYVMLSRQDNENIHLMVSDQIHFWYESQIIVRPRHSWEFVQLGNCGSPIETDAGWLVIDHGVGPMRKYCIGAFLLDRENPSKVLGRLGEPLLAPEASEREGYVPNVVYSCGGLLHNGKLILPYAVSDYATSFARISLKEILDHME